jgi:hypothetical protein
MSKHPPLKPGEVFVGNLQDGARVGPQFEGLYSFTLRKPAFDINGHPLENHSAIILSGSDCETYNRRQEARLEAIRSGKVFR